MHLKQYLENCGLAPAAFADQLGVNASTVYRAMQGGNVSNEVMRLIHEHSGGRVTPNDLTGLFDEWPRQLPEFPGPRGSVTVEADKLPKSLKSGLVAAGRLKRLLGIR